MTIDLDLQIAGELAVAGLAGLAVGIEREWSGHAAGPAARFAGARTMLLLGLLGGLAGWLIGGGLVIAGALLLAGGGVLTVAAYVMAARGGGDAIEGTTEVAALLVVALGLVSGLGFPLLTSAVASVMVLALVEKTRIQGAIKRLGERELAAALQFAVLALVILPLLPEGPYGPFDSIRPRALWAAVLLFSGLNFAGYLARRTVGLTRGYALTGLIGGIVSSTLVTIQFARRSRDEPAAAGALAVGVLGACTVVVARVGVLATVLNPSLGLTLAPYLLPVLGLAAACLALAFVRVRHSGLPEALTDDHSPLGLWAAVKMAVAFQLVLLAMPYIQDFWGAGGVRTSAVVIGMTDMDALTYSMTRLATIPSTVALAAQAILIGLLASTLLKLIMAIALGSGAFRRVAGSGLLAVGAATCLVLWIAR
jgi:uncharacterized membrane protein (DUF4010 family)